MEAGFLQHGEQFVVAQLVGRRAGDIGKCRLPVLPVGSCNFILRVGVRLSQEVFIAENTGQLHSDRRKIVAIAIDRAIDHVACECRGFHRVPLNLYVAVVAESAHIGWRR